MPAALQNDKVQENLVIVEEDAPVLEDECRQLRAIFDMDIGDHAKGVIVNQVLTKEMDQNIQMGPQQVFDILSKVDKNITQEGVNEAFEKAERGVITGQEDQEKLVNLIYDRETKFEQKSNDLQAQLDLPSSPKNEERLR